jgi:hypothetical protein
MNTQAIAIERNSRRPLMSGLHGGWSIGAFAGAGIGALAVGAGIALTPQLLILGSVALLGAGLLSTRLLPDHRDRFSSEPFPSTTSSETETPTTEPASAGGRSRWSARMLTLAAIAFASMLCEGAAANWASVYLSARTTDPFEQCARRDRLAVGRLRRSPQQGTTRSNGHGNSRNRRLAPRGVPRTVVAIPARLRPMPDPAALLVGGSRPQPDPATKPGRTTHRRRRQWVDSVELRDSAHDTEHRPPHPHPLGTAQQRPQPTGRRHRTQPLGPPLRPPFLQLPAATTQTRAWRIHRRSGMAFQVVQQDI